MFKVYSRERRRAVQNFNFAPPVFAWTKKQKGEEREEHALRPAHAHKNNGRRSEVIT
jgi:hypothetical protein